MSEIQLTLSDAERDLLVDLLHATIGDKRVEVRRTEFSAELHNQLRSEEELLRRVLEKLTAGVT
jgi:hypothetical protein